MQTKSWKILKQTDVSPSKWFPVVKDEIELPGGQVIEYFKSNLAHVAMVIPITVENEVVFVKQYKHGVEEICIEFPAGRIENGQTPEQAACRELAEETGINVEENQLIKLTELWTEPSKSSVRVTGFLVRDVVISAKQELELTENLEIIKVPVTEIHSFIKANSIKASDTLALLLMVKLQFPDLFTLVS